MEKRRFLRLPVDLPARLVRRTAASPKPSSTRARLIDLSQGGALVAVDEPTRDCAEVELAFRLPGAGATHHAVVRARGLVVRGLLDHGAGVRFIALHARDRSSLYAFLEARLPNGRPGDSP